MKKFLFILFTFLISCVMYNKPPFGHAYGYRAKYIFWYYPEYEIYYYPALKVYFIYKDNSWVKVEKVPFKLKSYIVIESDDEKPFERHHIYKQKFNIKNKPHKKR